MNDDYTDELVKKVTDEKLWPLFKGTDGFDDLAKAVKADVSTESVSGKIAQMFVYHQIVHELTKILIEMSLLYVQAEIWPTEFNPAYDNGKSKMTYWYITYYEEHCIENVDKEKYIQLAKRLNEIRNKVAHNLTGKNVVEINRSFNEFSRLYDSLIESYDKCDAHLTQKMHEISQRLDWDDFLSI